MGKRNLTVYEGSRKKQNFIPKILLQGQWLETLGFTIGDKITVDCRQNELIIKKQTEEQES